MNRIVYVLLDVVCYFVDPGDVFAPAFFFETDVLCWFVKKTKLTVILVSCLTYLALFQERAFRTEVPI